MNNGERAAMEMILEDLQAAALASPEPGQEISPKGLVVMDTNGLSFGGGVCCLFVFFCRCGSGR